MLISANSQAQPTRFGKVSNLLKILPAATLVLNSFMPASATAKDSFQQVNQPSVTRPEDNEPLNPLIQTIIAKVKKKYDEELTAEERKQINVVMFMPRMQTNEFLMVRYDIAKDQYDLAVSFFGESNQMVRVGSLKVDKAGKPLSFLVINAKKNSAVEEKDPAEIRHHLNNASTVIEKALNQFTTLTSDQIQLIPFNDPNYRP